MKGRGVVSQPLTFYYYYYYWLCQKSWQDDIWLDKYRAHMIDRENERSWESYASLGIKKKGTIQKYQRYLWDKTLRGLTIKILCEIFGKENKILMHQMVGWMVFYSVMSLKKSKNSDSKREQLVQYI